MTESGPQSGELSYDYELKTAKSLEVAGRLSEATLIYERLRTQYQFVVVEGAQPEQIAHRGPRRAAAFTTAIPKSVWRQIWSNYPLERRNSEIRRRTDVIGIFPNRPALIRLIGAALAEQNGEWAVTRQYMSLPAVAVAMSPHPLESQQDYPLALSA